MVGFDKTQQGSWQLRSLLILCSVFFVFMIAAGTFLSCVNSPSTPQAVVQDVKVPAVSDPTPLTAVEDLKLPAHGDTTLLTNVITPADEGREHIWPDHPVEYKTMPPTSGPHFPDPTEPGFYTTRPEFGYLVHSLEHGSAVIYYDPAKLSPEVEKSLRAFIKADNFPEVGVIAVPDADFKYPFILTAWDKMLKLDKYDPLVISAFLAEYLGRGPENPIR
jgi:hypothetical protein